MGASKCDLSCAMAATNWDAAPARRPRSEISVRALQEGSHLRSPGAKLTNLADLPFDMSFGPELKSSRPHQHLGGKILNLVKLLRKPKAAPPLPAQDFYQPSLRVLHFQDQRTQFPILDDITRRYNYDSDEHPQSSSSSSRTSNSEAESTRSSGSHLSNSQLMANILISIMDEEDVASKDVQTMVGLDGPHESAWHQPRDEATLADSPSARGRQSAAYSIKHLRRGPRSCAVAGDGLLTSPGPSRRFGKLDLSRIEVHRVR